MHPGELLQSTTSPAVAVALGASPAFYTAVVPGSIYIAGGTVTLITHYRNGGAFGLGILAGGIRLRKGDILGVTYAVIPTAVTFIPD